MGNGGTNIHSSTTNSAGITSVRMEETITIRKIYERKFSMRLVISNLAAASRMDRAVKMERRPLIMVNKMV